MRNNNEDSAQEITEMIHIKNTQDARMNRSEIRRQEIDKVLAEHFSEYHTVFGFEGDMNWSAQQQLSSSVTVQYDANKTNAILFLKMNPDDDLSITGIYVSKVPLPKAEPIISETPKVEAATPTPKPTPAPATRKIHFIPPPKGKGEIRLVPLSELQAAEANRSPQSRARDERLQHSVIVSPGSSRAQRWLRHPGSMDISGIDTKRSHGSITGGLKSKRIGKIYHTRVRGGTLLSRRPVGRKRRR